MRLWFGVALIGVVAFLTWTLAKGLEEGGVSLPQSAVDVQQQSSPLENLPASPPRGRPGGDGLDEVSGAPQPRSVPLAPAALEIGTPRHLNVQGIVIFPDGYERATYLEYVRVQAVAGDETVHETGVDSSGRWTMTDLKAATQPDFRVSGGALIHNEVTITVNPNDLDNLEVALYPNLGHQLWLWIAQPSGETVSSASATVNWLDREHSMVGRPREDGYTLVRWCPPGAVVVTARAPGWSTVHSAPITIPQLTPTTVELVLHPSASVLGRCTYQGRPVENFTVTWWRPEAETQPHSSSFSESVDGSFEIEDVLLGSVVMIATSDGLAPSHSVLVDTTSSAQEIVLSLRSPVPVVGRVLAASDRAPQAGVPCTLVALDSSGRVRAKLGEPVITGHDGKFELSACEGAQHAVSIRGPEGLANRLIPLSGRDEESIQLGDIVLEESGSIRLQLAPSALAPETVGIAGYGATPFAERPFSVDGQLLIEDVGDELVQLKSVLPDFTTLQIEVNPAPGAHLEYLVPLGNCSAEVRMPTQAKVQAHQAYLHHPQGYLFSHLFDDGVARFGHLGPGSYQLEVLNADGRRIASQGVFLDEGLIIVDATAGTEHVLRLVDTENTPVPAVALTVRSPSSDTLIAIGATDAKGEFRFSTAEASTLAVIASHPEVGIAAPILLEGTSTVETELVFDPQATLRFDVQDADGAPIPGAQVVLRDMFMNAPLGPLAITDPGGSASWMVTSESSFRTFIEHTGYWHHREDGVTPGTHKVILAREADLDLQVRNSRGEALANTAFALTRAADDAPVAHWIKSRGLTCSNPEMTTDNHGNWNVDRIPEGNYTLSVSGTSNKFPVRVDADSPRVTVTLP